MPRYVILRHDPPPHGDFRRHWDLMLEIGEVLKTWALAEEPCVARAIAADRLADHRVAYLEYEGPVSGGRGHVTRWDWGTYVLVASNDHEWQVRIQGERFDGTTILRCPEPATQRWTVEFLAGDVTSC